MRALQSSVAYSAVVIVGLLAACAGPGDAQSTRRPLIPGLPPMLQGLSLSNLPGISHIMNMPLPFNVPFSLSSFPPLRLPIRLPGILGGAGMIRNATHLIRNTFLGSPLSSSASGSSSSASGSSSSSLASSLASSSSSLASSGSSVGSALNANSLTQMLTAPFLPLLNLGSGNIQAVNRNGMIDPGQYAQYFRALQMQSAHERHRRSIVQHMLRHYQPSQPFVASGGHPMQMLHLPPEQLAQFRAFYRLH